MEDHLKLKKSGGTLKGVWRPHKTRDSMIGFIEYWVEPTEIPASRYRGWIGLSASKYGNWQKRSGQANEHNGQIPPDFWWEEWEPKAIRQYYNHHPLADYPQLTFMRLDQDTVAVSPS